MPCRLRLGVRQFAVKFGVDDYEPDADWLNAIDGKSAPFDGSKIEFDANTTASSS